MPSHPVLYATNIHIGKAIIKVLALSVPTRKGGFQFIFNLSLQHLFHFPQSLSHFQSVDFFYLQHQNLGKQLQWFSIIAGTTVTEVNPKRWLDDHTTASALWIRISQQIQMQI